MTDQGWNTSESPQKSYERVGRRNDRKRDAHQASLPERSPSLRADPRQQRSHPYLPAARNTGHRQRPMIRPSSVASMSGRSLGPSDCSDCDDRQFDVDEEMEGMTLDSPLPASPILSRPFPDKPYYWMNDYATLEYIRAKFPADAFYIMHNGKIVENFEEFIVEHMGQGLVKYSFHLRMRGGKGGFGSLLRSFRVNKSTNKLMMRDLNGRRMASVDEEARLKRYLERQARKEEEMKEKRKAKLAKLTAGPGKHQFEDQGYLSRREEIIEKTEDACEAGFALMKEIRRKKRMSKEEKRDSDDEDEEEDAEHVNDLFNDRGGRKRKIDAPTIGDAGDRKRIEDEDFDDEDSENDSENEPDPEELEAIRQYFAAKKNQDDDDGACSSSTEKVVEQPKEQETEPEPEPAKRPRLDSASNIDDLPKIDVKTPCEYGPIDLADFHGAEDLELLGLEHLKSALNDRGLKCGGSLSERAARLWMVKGKSPREYPKNILTPEMKKKVAAEEEAERKAAKKAKKSKK